MNNRTVDITNRKNRYCTHCVHCRTCDVFCWVKMRVMRYWNCCKDFEWRPDIIEKYRRAKLREQYEKDIAEAAVAMVKERGAEE